jgi:hypothetical protein
MYLKSVFANAAASNALLSLTLCIRVAVVSMRVYLQRCNCSATTAATYAYTLKVHRYLSVGNENVQVIEVHT